MFTGIIEETGTVLEFAERESAFRLQISTGKVREGLEMGDSIAVNGCCLTAVEWDKSSISFDLLAESVRLTSFQSAKEGDPVNLERSLRFNGKIGGHFVTGHIDATGKVTHAERRGKDLYLRIEPPAEFLKYLVYKGSIAIDGVSLTVAEVDESGFAVWLIPHTLEVTNLDSKLPGSLVNLEFDMLAKTLERLFPGNRPIERSE
jgi:riboflavin synthase